MASVTSALPRNTSSRLREIGTFALVGVVNTALDFAILNGLILLTHQDHGAWLFGFDLFAFSVGMLSSYFLNARVTFRQGNLASGGRVLRDCAGAALPARPRCITNSGRERRQACRHCRFALLELSGATTLGVWGIKRRDTEDTEVFMEDTE
jgi:hypothetical protein